MAEDIIAIMDMCKATNNPHMLWFERLLDSHFEGIIAHATYKISAGKIEGINNKIKTLRRQAYGYPDDEYFFLKLFDMSRRDYVRNPSSHKICDWAIFFKEPDGVSFTNPNGTFASLSHNLFRIVANTWKVALWEQDVDIPWKVTLPIQNTAMMIPSLK